MSVQRMTDEGTAMETQSFAGFLLRVGKDRNESCAQRGGDYSRIPQYMILSTEDEQDKASALIDHVYDGLGERYVEDGYFADRANAQGSDTSTFPEECLNCLRISGMAPHKPNLKVGAPIILLRNINGESGLCNGMRLQVYHMHDHYIEAKVLTDPHRQDSRHSSHSVNFTQLWPSA
ncbi:Helitron helicase [Phytophthora megakarya]|uniref:Helitron helicase n=1 Tax=Phytophthora megakarya TaxID=4795 RepID=A0A225WK33_9STRA|nr:Helitron helicase [Phytophthora megakarya]